MNISIEIRHTFTSLKNNASSLFLCLVLVVITPFTYAVDIFPGNGVPPPTGYQAIQSSFQANVLYIPSSCVFRRS